MKKVSGRRANHEFSELLSGIGTASQPLARQTAAAFQSARISDTTLTARRVSRLPLTKAKCDCCFGPAQRSVSGVFLILVANSTSRLIASARDGRSVWQRRQSSTVRKNCSDTRI
jgi:hypothetical protein